MKCWNSAVNALGSRVIIVVTTRAVKIYVSAVEALKKKKRGDEAQFTTKIGGKTSLGPSHFVLENFIPSYAFDALLYQNWPFSPTNGLITLFQQIFCSLDSFLKSCCQLMLNLSSDGPQTMLHHKIGKKILMRMSMKPVSSTIWSLYMTVHTWLLSPTVSHW